MKRREVLAGLVASGAFPRLAGAQSQRAVRKVVLFSIHDEASPAAKASFDALRESLQARGWNTGDNIALGAVWAGTGASLASLAAELARQDPDVIVAVSSAIVRALRTATPDRTIVFVLVSNPDGQGFVDSLSRPGGNITGFVHLEYSIGPKWVQLLKEIAPEVGRVLVVFNPDAIPAHEWLPPIEARSRSLGAEIVPAPVRDVAALDHAITEFAREPGGGLLIMPEAFTALHRDRIIALAADKRLPAIYPWDHYARAGGLISYGSQMVDLFRRAGTYVDLILKGEKPADLPVQQPARFEMLINLKTARALGLTIPPTLLLLADEVIE